MRLSIHAPQHWLCLLLLLLATAGRVYRLDQQSFWNDEGNAARLSERSPPLIIEGTASDIHPPLYYLLLRGWRELVGASEFGLRLFSVMAGVLQVAVTMRLGRLLGGATVGWWAGLLMALSPPLIYYSQEARMYSLLGLLAVWATWSWVAWQRQGGRWRGGVGYLLCLATGLYTHYFFPAIIAAHGLLMLAGALGRAGRSWRALLAAPRWWRWVGVVGAALLLYAPWMPIFLRSLGRDAGAARSWPSFLGEAGSWLLWGIVPPPTQWVWLVVAVLALAAWRSSAVRLLLVWVLVPLGLMGLTQATAAQYLKFLTAVVPALLVWLALGLAAVSRWVWGGRLGAAGLALLLLLTLFRATDALYHDPRYFRADYRGMAAQVEREAPPRTAVILNAPNQWEVFTYYYGAVDQVYPLPKSVTTEEVVVAELAAVRADRFYALFWGVQGFDPQRHVERWLATNAFPARDEWRGDVRFVTYGAAVSAPPLAVEAAVGEAIQLTGYALPLAPFVSGEIVPLTLRWQAVQPIDQRYKVFVHLINFEGALVAQRDSEPISGFAPTIDWSVGQLVVDNHGLFLPPDLPSGDYALYVGLYDAADPSQRLPITTPTGVVDALRLATITITSD